MALRASGSGVALSNADSDGTRVSACAIVAFRVDRENFDVAQADLRGRGIADEFQDHGVAHSIYFQDPDGLQLELTTYEI